MTSENAIVAGYSGWAEVANHPLQHAGINRAFLAAHLLTGSAERAERAIMEAIALWDLDQSDNELFEQVLRAAVQGTVEDVQAIPNGAGSPNTHLPAELQAVLRLAPQLRQCYVLRVLVGLPRQACASLLHLSSQQVDHYTCAALRCFPFLVAPSCAATEYSA
jgi:hypothetical protein